MFDRQQGLEPELLSELSRCDWPRRARVSGRDIVIPLLLTFSPGPLLIMKVVLTMLSRRARWCPKLFSASAHHLSAYVLLYCRVPQGTRLYCHPAACCTSAAASLRLCVMRLYCWDVPHPAAVQHLRQCLPVLWQAVAEQVPALPTTV